MRDRERVARLQMALPLLTCARMKSTNSSGFTLIEVLLVTVIIGILAGVAIAQYAGYRARGVDAKVVSAVRHVATAQESYYASHLVYTTSVVDLVGAVPADVAITIGPGNSGDLGSSFSVTGSHPGAPNQYLWVSDPRPGEANLTAN